MDRYFAGKELYGDDFSPAEIADWYADEMEAYADLGAKNAKEYVYAYHALNRHHGFRYLDDSYETVLGFGSAYGDELLPIISKVESVIIVDPSKSFFRESIAGRPATYIAPSALGDLPIGDGSVQLITCLGVLHHIPNVSHVLRELARVLAPGGTILIREPVVSMGDWRFPRRDLTKRERGIPVHLLEAAIIAAGLSVRRRSFCIFPLSRRMGRLPFCNSFVTYIDAALALAFRWNLRYHAATAFGKLRPTCAFFVATKRASE